ncbi:MAG: hypothetical protein ACPLQP_07295 [Moorellaceae bacterium]
MDNEKFQELVLRQLQILTEGLRGLETRLDGFKTGLDNMESRLGSVETHLGNMETRLDGVEARLTGVETRLGGMETRLDNMEDRLDNMGARLGNVEQSQQAMQRDIKELQEGQRRIETRMENEVIQKIGALFDARSVQEDINARIFSTLERIEAKIDVLQMETAHLRRVK